ncbi:MAG TPA: hypothetical protein VLR52_06290 [Bacteroidales bacterium]|nr:hypothetical protein [Bacteroidales bacterium]
MGFEDLFEQGHKQKRRGHYNDHYQPFHEQKPYHGQHQYPENFHHSGHGHGENQFLTEFLTKIRSNPGLKRWVIIAGVALLILSVILVVALMPLIIKLFNYISANGVKGITDGIAGFLDKLWKGTGK